MNPLKIKLYYQWFLLIRRCWKKIKIRFFRYFFKNSNNIINTNNVHFLVLRANIYNDFYLALISINLKKKIKDLLYIYIYLNLFLNYKKKNQEILKLNTYLKVTWSLVNNLDEKKFKKEIFNNNKNIFTLLNIIKHILLLNIYIFYLWFEYFFIIKNKLILIYEYNLFLYWGFENRYFFIKLYKLGLIIINLYNFIKKIKNKINLSLIDKLILINLSIKNKLKSKFKTLFFNKYEKRHYYFSYYKIIIYKITKKIKFYISYFFSYRIWKWYFFLKYENFKKFYSYLFLYLMEKNIITNLKYIFNYYNIFFYNIFFYKKILYFKIKYKCYNIKNIILNIYKKLK